ncbi:LuxR family transcriptional regulator [Oleomonas cavernae]|uniref:LuxR family transcriptional regulator n=1 Tax=Oleomonas cavernae TaxID=2320859 RepID=A0A418WAI1_9PROT|nr:LuxR C-terminal-related transcriptional regulator [Oleomonas cavernae]RJF87022.1 LuxR family transcriptional regulator [Oleomonas cavernae]
MARVDIDTVANAVAGLYEAAYDPSAWPATIEALCGLFGGSKACLCRQGPNLQASDVISTAADPAYAISFIDEYAYQPNPLMNVFETVPVGLVYSDHAMVGRETLRRSKFWTEWMAPQDMYGGLAVKLLRSGASSWFFDVQRGRNQESFDRRDADLLERILPHLQRAAEISWKSRTSKLLASAFAQLPFAVILVDGHQQIAGMNEAADAVLARGDLSARNGRLGTRDLATTRALHQLVIAASKSADGVPGVGGELLIAGAAGRSPLALSVAPLRDVQAEGLPMGGLAAVFIRELGHRDRPDFGPRLQALFGLTRKEAEVATALVAGCSLKEAAAGSGIGITTARTHIASMLRKTHTAGQVQLVALLTRAMS